MQKYGIDLLDLLVRWLHMRDKIEGCAGSCFRSVDTLQNDQSGLLASTYLCDKALLG